MNYGYYGFAPYVSVATKKAKALKQLALLKKKNPDISPLIVQGNKLANTWWGKAWNTNLQKYADFENRIGRGRSYVKNGFVLDFKINTGQIKALIQGTRQKPYEVSIKIKPLNKTAESKIKQHCEGKIESLQELIEGRFPKELSEVFTAQGDGLFPTPQEISFNCSCPDWASMCKHVAATLYGVGVKLDSDPKLFFRLRNTDMNSLITEAVRKKSKKMLKAAEKKTSRVLVGLDTAAVFGIDLNDKAEAFKTTASKKVSLKISKNKLQKVHSKKKSKE